MVMALFSYCLQRTEKTKRHKEQMCDALGLKTAKKGVFEVEWPQIRIKTFDDNRQGGKGSITNLHLEPRSQ